MKKIIYPNGSMLTPDILTSCNECYGYELGEHSQCKECQSEDVEIIREDNLD